MKKGISPLIAAVILIAFVIAMAGIASGFLTKFIKERKSEVSEAGEESVNCAVAYFTADPDSVTYDGENLSLTVYNRGRTSLSGFNMTVYVGNETDYTSGMSDTLNPGGSASLTGSTQLGGSITKIKVTTSSCPGKTYTLYNRSDGWSSYEKG